LKRMFVDRQSFKRICTIKSIVWNVSEQLDNAKSYVSIKEDNKRGIVNDAVISHFCYARFSSMAA
jgi:hypothetical protein